MVSRQPSCNVPKTIIVFLFYIYGPVNLFEINKIKCICCPKKMIVFSDFEL